MLAVASLRSAGRVAAALALLALASPVFADSVDTTETTAPVASVAHATPAPKAAPAAPAKATLPASVAQVFAIDPVHSHVGFSIRHLVSRARGNFGDVQGTITTNPADLSTTKAEVTIATASIDTDNAKRDGHLKSADFFDVEKYPDMKFVLEAVKLTDESSAMAKGQLTLRGITKPVELVVKDISFGKGFGGKDILGFWATGTIKRSDYGMSWNKALDAGSLILGDEVNLDINIEALQPDPVAAAGQ